MWEFYLSNSFTSYSHWPAVRYGESLSQLSTHIINNTQIRSETWEFYHSNSTCITSYTEYTHWPAVRYDVISLFSIQVHVRLGKSCESFVLVQDCDETMYKLNFFLKTIGLTKLWPVNWDSLSKFSFTLCCLWYNLEAFHTF